MMDGKGESVRGAARGREGIALIVVLGLLLVLTAMAVGFSVVMRTGGLSARRYADRTRARYFARAGVTLCMGTLGGAATNTDSVFPYWEPLPPAASGHAFASVSSLAVEDTPELIGLATNWVPASLWGDLTNVVPQWKYLLGVSATDGSVLVTNGRVAYVAINCAGLVDIHALAQPTDGGTNQRYRLGALEEDVLTDADAESTLDALALHREYTSLAELTVLNEGIVPPVHDLFIYSYDPNPYQYFTNVNELGMRWIGLTNRFNVNGITNFLPADYGTAAFSNEWFAPYVSVLEGVGVSNAASVAWATVNLLDADRVPQGATDSPWAEASCVEAVPLINEIVVRSASGAASSNLYEVAVELWYPFASDLGSETFTVQVGVFEDSVLGVAETDIMGSAKPEWSFTAPLGAMAYGDATEFQVVQTPDASKNIGFPAPAAVGGGVADLPLGVYVDPVTGALSTNDLYLLVRVLDSNGAIVDEAPGYMSTGLDPEREMLHVIRPGSYEVNDPRDNGRRTAWVSSETHTLGGTNIACLPDSGWQGLPIVHFDRPLDGVWELGQAYTGASNAWRNLNLLGGQDSAAGLLDRVSVTNVADLAAPWEHGRININTRSTNVIQALFQSIDVVAPSGFPGGSNQVWYAQEAQIDAFADALIQPDIYSSVGDIFPATPEGALRGGAFKAMLPTNRVPHLDYLQEQLLGRAAESMSFRQNIFVVVVMAQATNPTGARVQAEVRIMALVYRDAWTGNWFIKDWREI